MGRRRALMSVLEDLIRQSDALVSKLRSANDLVRRAEDIVTQTQAGLTEAVRILRSRKDDYNRLHEDYQLLQRRISAARTEYARTHSTPQYENFGPLSGEDQAWLRERLAPPPSPPRLMQQARALPTVRGYFYDARLQEFRKVNNPHIVVSAGSVEGQRLYAELLRHGDR